MGLRAAGARASARGAAAVSRRGRDRERRGQARRSGVLRDRVERRIARRDRAWRRRVRARAELARRGAHRAVYEQLLGRPLGGRAARHGRGHTSIVAPGACSFQNECHVLPAVSSKRLQRESWSVRTGKAAVWILATLLGASLAAQQRPRFEVASIKRTESRTLSVAPVPRAFPGGRFNADFTTVAGLMW